MRINLRTSKVALLLAATAIAVSGCGNISHGVSSDGTSADTLVWPALSETTPMHRGGTLPGIDDVRKVRPGLNKNQVADLIGFPHFSEGVWGVREWNYVFNFRDAGSDTLVTCQFKILFDTNKLVRSTYWSPESCNPENKTIPAMVKGDSRSTPEKNFVISSDTLFPFNESSVDSIRSEGKDLLNNLVRSLQSVEDRVVDIRIDGYADRLGTIEYNEELSRKRAFSIRDYLVSKGIASDLIRAEGRGNEKPVKQCASVDHSDLIDCLAPNRRVEVRVRFLDHRNSDHGAE